VFDRWMVMTDLDGTLLNHHSYDYQAAEPALKKLQASAIPVIFNSSKTYAELKSLSGQLEIHHPFIVENGSAIFIPQHYFGASSASLLPAEALSIDDFLVIITGQDINRLNAFLDHTEPAAINFCRCPLELAMELTGLNKPEALLARDRQFSVPLVFDDQQQQADFQREAERAGLSCLRGGRFLHLLGRCDKGVSMMVLRELYQKIYQQSFGVIALGDGQNDLAMLQQADIAVLVKSPSSIALSSQYPEFITTQQQAPAGWAEGVQAALEKINLNRGIQYGR